jgi:hypothetical protein
LVTLFSHVHEGGRLTIMTASPVSIQAISRFELNQAAVEALRTVFLEDLVARPLEKEERTGRLWDRQGNHWLVFDVDGTRQVARERCLAIHS